MKRGLRVLAVFVAFLLPGQGSVAAYAQDGRIADVGGWAKASDPFNDQPANSFSGTAVVDAKLGSRAVFTIGCNENSDYVDFDVGLANGNFDIGYTQNVHKDVHSNNYTFFDNNPSTVTVYTTQSAHLTVRQRLDKNDAWVADLTGSSIGGTNKISFQSYQTQYLVDGEALLIGIPMNGGEQAFRISLKEPNLKSFLSQCYAGQQRIVTVETKLNREQERAAGWCGNIIHSTSAGFDFQGRFEQFFDCLATCPADDDTAKCPAQCVNEKADRYFHHMLDYNAANKDKVAQEPPWLDPAFDQKFVHLCGNKISEMPRK